MKLHIRPKMIIAFLAMSVLLLALAIASIFYSNRMMQNSSKILTENVASLKAAEELEIALLEMKGLTANYLLDGNEKWIHIFNDKRNAFIYWFSEAKQRSNNQKEDIILSEISMLFEDYIDVQKTVLNLYKENQRLQAANVLTNELINDFNLIFSKCEDLLNLNEMFMNETNSLISNDNKTINALMYGIGLAGLLLGLSLGLVLSKNIIKPLYKIVLKMKDATEDELIDRVDFSESSEIHNLDEYAKLLIEKVNTANKNLEQNRRLLHHSEKMAALGKMASGLAHEIRNPLTAIKMLVFSLFQESKNNPVILQDLEVIIKEIERLELFIQNFLDFARPPKPSFVLTDLNEVIETSVTLLSAHFKTNKIKINKNLMPDLPQIIADKDQLHHVFVNLLINAIQSIKKEGIISILSECNETVDSKHISVIVSDNGSGIPTDIIGIIFDPFVSAKEDGTGLGLSIAHQIISTHNGWLKAENNLDKGAKFTVLLPIEMEK